MTFKPGAGFVKQLIHLTILHFWLMKTLFVYSGQKVQTSQVASAHCSMKPAPVWPLLLEYNAMRCDAMRCDAMRCDAMRCDAMRCDAMRCDAMRCDAMRCDAMRCDAMRCDAMRCDAMRCDAMRCDAMRCDAIRYDTIQYNTISISSVRRVPFAFIEPIHWSLDGSCSPRLAY